MRDRDEQDGSLGEGGATAPGARGANLERQPGDKRKWGRCPRCLNPRPGNDDPDMGFSFVGGCQHCDYRFIPEDAEPKLYVMVCPICGKQQDPPRDHRSGYDKNTRCHHALPGQRGTTPRWIRIEVVPAEPLVLLPIPEDRKPVGMDDRPSKGTAARGVAPHKQSVSPIEKAADVLAEAVDRMPQKTMAVHDALFSYLKVKESK